MHLFAAGKKQSIAISVNNFCPKKSWPENGPTTWIPYNKNDKIHVLFWCQKKNWEVKNSVQPKHNETVGLLPLFLLRTLSSKSSNSGGGGKDLPHIHLKHLRLPIIDLQG